MAMIVFVVCGIEAIYDIKTKHIHSGIWGSIAIIGGVWNVLQNGKDLLWIFMAMLIGLFLMICSKIFRGSIGIGDGIVFLALGLVFGLKDTSNLLFYSLVLSLVWGSGLLVLKKCSRTKELPFLPFIFIGLIFMYIL